LRGKESGEKKWKRRTGKGIGQRKEDVKESRDF